MMNHLRQEKDKIIDYSIIKDIKHLFRVRKENKAIKDRIIRRNRRLFEEDEENHQKLEKVCEYDNGTYIKNENKADQNKTLSTEEYLNNIRTFLKNIMGDVKRKSGTWKI